MHSQMGYHKTVILWILWKVFSGTALNVGQTSSGVTTLTETVRESGILLEKAPTCSDF